MRKASRETEDLKETALRNKQWEGNHGPHQVKDDSWKRSSLNTHFFSVSPAVPDDASRSVFTQPPTVDKWVKIRMIRFLLVSQNYRWGVGVASTGKIAVSTNLHHLLKPIMWPFQLVTIGKKNVAGLLHETIPACLAADFRLTADLTDLRRQENKLDLFFFRILDILPSTLEKQLSLRSLPNSFSVLAETRDEVMFFFFYWILVLFLLR